MQNRYAGDVGDFGKLGLLRQLTSSQLDIGVNWYLAPDESHNAYLHEWMLKIEGLYCKEAMKNLYNLVIEYFSKDKRLRFWRAITFIPNQQLNSLFAQLISEKDAIFKQKMQRCFLKGQSNGEIRPDVSLGSLRLYLCMIQGVLDGMLLSPEELRYKDNADELFEAYWDGICTSRAE